MRADRIPHHWENPDTPAADEKTEPSITGMLIQSDEGEAIPVDPTLWLYSLTERKHVHNDFLIDSGAATSVCQQSQVDSLGGIPRGLGVELRSATGHQFTTTGQYDDLLAHTRMVSTCLETFRSRPRLLDYRGLSSRWDRVCDRGNIFTFPQYWSDDTQRICWQSN